MKQLTCNGIGLVLVLGMLGLPAGAQNQAPSNTPDSSLGTYARQERDRLVQLTGGTPAPKPATGQAAPPKN